MGGWFVLFVLTSIAAFSAFAVVARLELESRAEQVIAWTVVFFTLTAGPVMLLGYLHVLTRGALAPAAMGVSAGAFFLAAGDDELKPFARRVGGIVLSVLRVPLDAFRLAIGARSLTTLGLVVALVLVVWSVVLSWYAPSENWDGFFYHEPMVGFAIQNHGFSVVPLPPIDVVQQTNGYPRVCESLAIWFCIFTDRTLIEIGNSIAAPGFLAAMYALARERTDDRVGAMGLSVALLLVPAIYTQLRTSLVDLMVAFFLLSALHFALRLEVKRREAILGSLCLVLLVGSKGTALVWAPPIGIVLYVRYVLQAKGGRWRALGISGLGVLGMAGIASLTLVRNWINFKNPVWPVTYEIHALHVTWQGLITMDAMGAETTLKGTLEDKLLAMPIGGTTDIIRHDYGYAVGWVVLPLTLLSGVVSLVRAIRARVRRAPDRLAESAVLAFVVGVLFVKLPPGPAVARYNIHIIALALTVIAAASRREGSRFSEGAVGAALLLGIAPWWWTNYWGGLDMTPEGIDRLFAAPAAERATMNFATFQMPEAVARQRDAELGRGDLVMFTAGEPFIGVLWNHRFSNRVEYAPFETSEQFLGLLEQRCAKWVLVGSEGNGALVAHPDKWQLVGTGTNASGTLIYRRLGACAR